MRNLLPAISAMATQGSSPHYDTHPSLSYRISAPRHGINFLRRCRFAQTFRIADYSASFVRKDVGIRPAREIELGPGREKAETGGGKLGAALTR